MQGLVMTMKRTVLRQTLFGLCLAVGFWVFFFSSGQAADLPTATSSPIAGIVFDDPPLVLPPQRNFQMAMLIASSELGRSCGKMEVYGWRLAGDEQPRVDRIFNNAVDRLRAQGYAVESKTASGVSRDVTLFSADREGKHMIFLWSAGEIGLVMVLCETSAPLSPVSENVLKSVDPSLPASAPPTALVPSSASGATDRALPLQAMRGDRKVFENFSPVGAWSGTYACGQGTTGGTLAIERMKGDRFEGFFSFYPTPKNPYVPDGKYLVSGEYDADTMRILVNPGKWIKRPKDFYNTIMIGSFDPVAGTFSGYFQGIAGCTSFEAQLNKDSIKAPAAPKKEAGKVAPKKAKKKAAKKKEAEHPAARSEGAALKESETKAKEDILPAAAPPIAAPAGITVKE